MFLIWTRSEERGPYYGVAVAVTSVTVVNGCFVFQ